MKTAPSLVVTKVNTKKRSITVTSTTPDWLRGRKITKSDVEHVLVHIAREHGADEILSHFHDVTIEEEYFRRTPLAKALQEGE